MLQLLLRKSIWTHLKFNSPFRLEINQVRTPDNTEFKSVFKPATSAVQGSVSKSHKYRDYTQRSRRTSSLLIFPKAQCEYGS